MSNGREQALRMALGRREPQAELLHHSDRGSQYTSDGYVEREAKYGISSDVARDEQ